MEVLEHSVNRFNGAVIERNSLPEDPDLFGRRLAHSLKVWKSDGILIIWLEVPIGRADLIPVSVRAGFEFHHTGGNYLMMVIRLAYDAFVPGFATHYIGAGGVVLNERNELLVVSERHRRSPHPSYKLPGGALRPGEHLVDCVIREISEETGIETEFEALVCFRHWHGYRYAKSDIYFICRLRPCNFDITRQDAEIEECLWMPVEEYLQSEYVHTFNRTVVRAALESPGVVPHFIDGYSDSEKYEIFMPTFAFPDG